jgi:hypothetical protein
MTGMTLKRIALGFAVTPPLPAALWAVSLWRDHGSVGIAAYMGIFLGVLPSAYLIMAVVGLPTLLLAGRMGGWVVHLFAGILTISAVEIIYLTLVLLSNGGLTFSELPSVLAVVIADAASHWMGSLLLPALYGAVAGWIFWTVTRAEPEPFQGRFG